MNIKGKVILIIGINSDIGICLTNKLKENNTIIGTYYHSDKLMKDIIYYKCNITDEVDVTTTINNIINKYGKIDILINLAASYEDKDIFEKDKISFMHTLETNMFGTFLVCQKVLKDMNNGVIINMSSDEADNNYNIYSIDYDASKAGIENITKNLAKYFKNNKIMALAPGYIDTKSTLEIEWHYLESMLKENKQKRLLSKEEVTDKLIDMIENDKYVSGEIVRMVNND